MLFAVVPGQRTREAESRRTRGLSNTEHAIGHTPKGIETDVNFRWSKRQVTIIERVVFDRVATELPTVDTSREHQGQRESREGHAPPCAGAR